MPGFTLSKRFNAPVDVVFAAMSQVESMPGRIKGIVRMELLTPGPIGLGTRFKETRVMFKKEHSETFEFTAFEPNARYELTAVSCGAEYRTDFRFAADGAGTRVNVQMTIAARSFFAKLMRPLASLMMGTMKKCVMADLDDVERSLADSKVA